MEKKMKSGREKMAIMLVAFLTKAVGAVLI
jgi:hypothetical protein